MNKRKELATQEELEDEPRGLQAKRERKESSRHPGGDASVEHYDQTASLSKSVASQTESATPTQGVFNSDRAASPTLTRGLSNSDRAASLIPTQGVSNSDRGSSPTPTRGVSNSDRPASPTPTQGVTIPEFHVCGVDKPVEIAAAVQRKAAEEVIKTLVEERFVNFYPKSAEQEKLIRAVLLHLQISYVRWPPMSVGFLIGGLLATTRPEDVAAELASSGIGARDVRKWWAQEKQGYYFTFKAPKGQMEAVQEVDSLDGQEVLIRQTFCHAPSTSQTELLRLELVGAIRDGPIRTPVQDPPRSSVLQNRAQTQEEQLTEPPSDGNILPDLLDELEIAPSRVDKLSNLLSTLDLYHKPQ